MPLQVSFSSEVDVNAFASAYVEIDSISMKFPRGESPYLEVVVLVWSNKATRDAAKRPLRTITLQSTAQQYNGFIQACVNGANPVTLVTNFLKNHAKFAGSVEVE